MTKAPTENDKRPINIIPYVWLEAGIKFNNVAEFNTTINHTRQIGITGFINDLLIATEIKADNTQKPKQNQTKILITINPS